MFESREPYSRSLLSGLVIALVFPFASSRALSSNASQAGAPTTARNLSSFECGLGKAFHAERRAQLLSMLDVGIVVLRGLPETRGYETFQQDKAFWYLTGIESPDASLVIDVESGQQTLFLPGRNARKESWDGELWDAEDEWVSELTGFDDVRPQSSFGALLAELVGEKKTQIWTPLAPHVELGGCNDRARPYDSRREEDPFDGRKSREEALAHRLEERFDVIVQDLSPYLDAMRRVKTAEEIAAMRRASVAGARAMVEAVRSTRPGLYEWEIEALMSWVQRREGATGPAYYAIVGSGPNALVLHYSANTRAMQAGEMLLIDYGPELDHYTTDITRSWPVDGEFTPRMAELYDIVLEAQQAGIAAVEPGITMREVHLACMAVFKKHGVEELARHGSCHYIGLEVHDVGRSADALVAGVAFTVEPGLYDPESGIGIRIEDVVVVTEDACEVLSAGVPKDRASLERLVAARGVLDGPAQAAPSGD